MNSKRGLWTLALGLVASTLLSLVMVHGALAAPKSLADKHYLSKVTVDSGADRVAVSLGLKGKGKVTLRYLSKGVQLTIQDAFLMPAKQHIPVDHPLIREVFAYQYDPDTVRVRILTDGISGTALKGQATAKVVDGGLLFSVNRLPIGPKAATVAAKSDNVAKPAKSTKANRAAKTQLVSKVPPKAKAVTKAAPKAMPVKVDPETVEPETTPEATPIPLPEARRNALAALENILANNPKSTWKGLKANPAEDVGEPSMAVLMGSSHPAGAGTPALKLVANPRPLDMGAGAPADLVAPDVAKAVQAGQGDPQPSQPSQGSQGSKISQPAPLKLTPLTEVGGGAPSLWQSAVKMAAGLALVLGLMLGILALVKRFKVTGLTGRVPIRVLGSAAVGSRQSVVVVEVDGRRLVVGVGPGGMARLADLDTAQSVDGEGTAADGEGDLVAAANTKHSDDHPGDDDPDAPARRADKTDTPFGQAMRQADDGLAADAIARTTRDLKRHLQLLRSGAA